MHCITDPAVDGSQNELDSKGGLEWSCIPEPLFTVISTAAIEADQPGSVVIPAFIDSPVEA